MENRGNHDQGNEAVAMLASTVVVLLGVSICLATIFAFASDPQKPLMFLSGGLFTIFFFVWLLRDRPKRDLSEKKGFWNYLFQKKEPELEYEPTFCKPVIKEIDGQRPPTAESIREIKKNSDYWSPSISPKKRSPKK